MSLDKQHNSAGCYYHYQYHLFLNLLNSQRISLPLVHREYFQWSDLLHLCIPKENSNQIEIFVYSDYGDYQLECLSFFSVLLYPYPGTFVICIHYYFIYMRHEIPDSGVISPNSILKPCVVRFSSIVRRKV